MERPICTEVITFESKAWEKKSIFQAVSRLHSTVSLFFCILLALSTIVSRFDTANICLIFRQF